MPPFYVVDTCRNRRRAEGPITDGFFVDDDFDGMRPQSQVRLATYVVVILIGLLVSTRVLASTTMSRGRGVVRLSTTPRTSFAMMITTTSLPNTKVSARERVPPIVLAAQMRRRVSSSSRRLVSSRSSPPTLNWSRRTIEETSRARTAKITPAYTSSPSSSSPSTADASWSLLSSDEERSAYAELVALSKRVRALDESYYGANDDDGASSSSTDGESTVSDDEYDALARREAELCIAHPHLRVMLEKETGLGSTATRYGGRVGRSYDDDDDIVDNNDEKSIEQTSTRSKTTTSTKKKEKKKKTTSSRTRSTTPKRIKRQHLVNSPMLSLDNAMNDNEAVSWLNRVRIMLLKEEAAVDTASNSNAINNDATSDDTTTATATTTTSIKMKSTPRTMQILAEPKIDGLGLSLRYRLGDNDNEDDCNIYHFIWGATRGDGTKGEDVTEAVRSAWMMMGEESNDNSTHGVPHSFAIPKAWNNSAGVQQQYPNELEIRGEVVLPKKAFDDLFVVDSTATGVDTTDNESISSSSSTTLKFSNARNAASGILLRTRESAQDSAEAEQTKFLRSHVRFYAYDFVASPPLALEENDVNLTLVIGNDGIEMREKLTSLGFCVPSPVVLESIDITAGVELDVSNISNLIRYHRNLMAARDGDNTNVAAAEHVFPFQIDGVVYKLSSFTDRRICGSSSRAPRWAIAHKFPSTSAVTRLLDIEVQVGRTGALTPVAILEPVSLSGVMVSRASLHNFHFARKLLLPAKKCGTPTLDLLVDDEGSIGVKKGISLLVGRAGDVIPQVKKRVFEDYDDDNDIAGLHSDEMISLKDPHVCPACGSPATFDFVTATTTTTTIKRQKKASSQIAGTNEDESVDEDESIDAEVRGQVLRCSGPQLLCPPRAVNGLAYAYSRAGLDVKGLSKAKIGQLMEEGIIRFPADLFAIYGGANDNSSSAEHDGKFN